MLYLYQVPGTAVCCHFVRGRIFTIFITHTNLKLCVAINAQQGGMQRRGRNPSPVMPDAMLTCSHTPFPSAATDKAAVDGKKTRVLIPVKSNNIPPCKGRSCRRFFFFQIFSICEYCTGYQDTEAFYA